MIYLSLWLKIDKLEDVYKRFIMTLPLKFKQIRNLFFIFIALYLAGAFFQSVQDGAVIWGRLSLHMGALAWGLLIFTIYISLASKLFPRVMLFRQFFPLRKHTGLMAFFVAIFHAVFFFLRINILGNWNKMFEVSLTKSWSLFFGTVSILIMIPLAITSTQWAIKLMGARGWRYLHKLTHVVFILAGLHIAFQGGGAIEMRSLWFLIIYALGYLWLFFRRFFSDPFVREAKN